MGVGGRIGGIEDGVGENRRREKKSAVVSLMGKTADNHIGVIMVYQHSRRANNAGLAALVLAILGGAGRTQAEGGWLPCATAPAGQWGGVLSAQYEQRKLGGTDATVKRGAFRLGGTPVSWATVWGEAGVAALGIEDAGVKLQGDYGTALGAGVTVVRGRIAFLSLEPFASGQATMFISRLSSDGRDSRGVYSERRSRFEWREVSGVAGLSLVKARWMLSGGVAARALSQTESRNLRVYGIPNPDEFTYKSGLETGLRGTLFRLLPMRFYFSLAAEVYPNSAGATLTVGQWGSPRIKEEGE